MQTVMYMPSAAQARRKSGNVRSPGIDDMLSVTRLIAISIENQLEYVSCKYKIDSKFIKLDGKPVSENCSISISSGSWLTHGNRKICSEKELDQCLFDIDC